MAEKIKNDQEIRREEEIKLLEEAGVNPYPYYLLPGIVRVISFGALFMEVLHERSLCYDAELLSQDYPVNEITDRT